MPMQNAVRSARLLLCQDSKDDDAVAVKPVLAFSVLLGRRMYLWPKRIFVLMMLDAQPVFRLELHYAADASVLLYNYHPLEWYSPKP